MTRGERCGGAGDWYLDRAFWAGLRPEPLSLARKRRTEEGGSTLFHV